MAININRIDGPSDIHKAGKGKKVKGQDHVAPINQHGSDRVSISEEAKQASELVKMQKKIKESPDIRRERVSEVRTKMAQGEYDDIDHKLLDRVADKIAQSFIR